MIAVVDYGLGNLFSLSCSLTKIQAPHQVTSDPTVIAKADKLILPGVGAFRDAIELLDQTGLGQLVIDRVESGVPLMGICLGMQLLFERSFEYGEHTGLGLIPGDICPIEPDLPAPLKVPQMGWNSLTFHRDGLLTRGISEGDFVYYVHSFYAKGLGDALVASSEYGVEIPGIVQNGHVCGTQFHPEKSGDVGLRILRAYCGQGSGVRQNQTIGGHKP